MPIPSIDISCDEMLSASIAFPPLYRWNTYRAFGTDIVRNLAEALFSRISLRLARALHRQRCYLHN